MRAGPRPKTVIMLLAGVAFFILLVTEVARENPVGGPRRTEPLRQNMARLRKVLMTVERQFESVHQVNETRQVELMHDAVGLLKDYLLPHLAAEEAVLYPAVDNLLPPSPASATQALIREHDLMRLWIREMESLADGAMPDHNAFARRGERLLGLIEAHFAVEEAVLFPVLDGAAPLTRRPARETP